MLLYLMPPSTAVRVPARPRQIRTDGAEACSRSMAPASRQSAMAQSRLKAQRPLRPATGARMNLPEFGALARLCRLPGCCCAMHETDWTQNVRLLKKHARGCCESSCPYPTVRTGMFYESSCPYAT
eukprot:355485-Chlamydomonas_euryale.AAC.1